MSQRTRSSKPDTFEVGAGTLGLLAALFLVAVALEPSVQTATVVSWLPFAAPFLAAFVALLYRGSQR